MAIGYTKVDGTLYEIGPAIEEWQPIGELTVEDAGSGTTKKAYSITPSLSGLYEYSQIRMKLVCSAAGTFSSTTAAATVDWWVWLDNSSAVQATTDTLPICLLCLEKNRTGSSGGTFNFSSYLNVESAWSYLMPVSPGAYTVNTKSIGNTTNVASDFGGFCCGALNFSATPTVGITYISLNSSSLPIYLHTFCRAKNDPTKTDTAYSGTRTFTYKLVIEGLKDNVG